MRSALLLAFSVVVILQQQVQTQETDSVSSDIILAGLNSLLSRDDVREGIAQVLLQTTLPSDSDGDETPAAPAPVATPSAPAATPSEAAPSATPTQPAPTPAAGGSLPDNTKTFLQVLGIVNMTSMLSSAKYTAFAPTDAAFQSLAGDLGVTLEELLQDKAQLKQIVDNHFVADKIVTFNNGDKYLSDAGKNLTISKPEDDSPIVVRTVGSNGEIKSEDVGDYAAVVHIVDQVLLPFKKSGQDTLFVAIKSSSRLSTLASVIEAAGLQEVFSDSEEAYTIFAPNNYAFEQVLGGDLSVEQLSVAGQDILRDMLYYHVVPTGRYSTNTLQNGQQLQTLIGGEKITYVSNENGTAIRGSTNRANIVEADIYAGKGVIHIIDAVLDYVPTEESSTSTVSEEIKAPGLETQESMQLSASAQANSSQNEGMDLSVSLSITTDAPVPSPIPQEEVEEVVQGALAMFIDAIEVGEVEIELSGDQAYTIFAPTVSAFEKMLSEYKAADFESMSRNMLRDIIAQHVVVGKFAAEDLVNGITLEAFQDPSLRVLSNNGTTVIASTGARAYVVVPDLPIENSVVHIVDKVLVPFVPTVPFAPNSCTDVPPDFRFDCIEQLEFGKCEEDWMIEANYCQKTCDRCDVKVVSDVCDVTLEEKFRVAIDQIVKQNSNSSCTGDELQNIILEAVEKVIAANY